MVVFVLKRVPKSVRGHLSRYSLEISAGVFVCKINKRVRDALWEKILDGLKGGKAIMVWTLDNEQGYDFKMVGYSNKMAVDFDGLKLVRILKNA